MKYVIIFFSIFCSFLTIEAAMPWLRTNEEKIVDERGNEVQLRGINLGGWLVEELWMMPFKKQPPQHSSLSEIRDHKTLWKAFESRFYTNDIEEIKTALRKNWLTEADFVRIREAGFTCVRIPFLCDLASEPKGLFYWLDLAVEYARNQNLYIILDMHGAPGRQSKSAHTGEEGKNQFFSDPAMIEEAAKIWASIAEHYKDCSCIAGYDLLNEPTGAANTATLHLVQDKLYRAIRAVDTKHIIIIEDGFKSLDRMPCPRVVGWQNVVFSTHLYTKGYTSEKEVEERLQDHLATFLKVRQEYKVPLYVGEFNFEKYSTPERIKSFLLKMKEHKISWSFWTYKVAGWQGENSSWGLYSRSMKKIDPFTDNKKKILKKISKTETVHFHKNEQMHELLSL
jgi:endoglucanase